MRTTVPRGGENRADGALSDIARQTPIDAAIATRARRQHGNVTPAQLLGLGLNRDAISHRVQTGRLFRVHRTVYAVGRPPANPLERASAAVLACGPGAVLSHVSAAALWGLQKRWSEPFHVTVAKDRRPRGIHVHHGKLPAGERRTNLGLRLTSPERTLLDWAPELDGKALTRAVNDARLTGLLHLDALADVVARHLNHPGAGRLRPLIGPGSNPTRSEFEDAFRHFCARYDLPTPQVNVRVAGHEVDMLFPRHRVIVELDGYEFHGDRRSFEADRDRDADTLAVGHITVRVTWDRLDRTPAREADRLRQILATRG